MTAHAKSRPSGHHAVRAVEKVHQAPSPERTLLGLATSRPARIAYMVVGTAGLAALTVALIGPGRLERQVVRPLRGAIEPQAEKLWAESKPLRTQLARLMQNASPAGRARLVRNFQSWIGHFHAS